MVFFIWRDDEESAAAPLAEAEIASDDMVESSDNTNNYLGHKELNRPT